MNTETLETPERPSAHEEFSLPKDGPFHIAPLGEFPHAESGLTQILDKKAFDSIAAAFAKDRSAGRETLIDFDHESNDPSKRTTAAGWIQGLEVRPDGLFARIKWSRAGREAVSNGEFRFVSPVWQRSDCEDLGGNRIRPLKLDSVGLTNKPNLRGAEPLSNSSRDVSARMAAACALLNSERKGQAVRQQELHNALVEIGITGDAAERQALRRNSESVTANRVKCRALELLNSRQAVGFDAAWRTAKRELLTNSARAVPPIGEAKQGLRDLEAEQPMAWEDLNPQWQSLLRQWCGSKSAAELSRMSSEASLKGNSFLAAALYAYSAKERLAAKAKEKAPRFEQPRDLSAENVF